MNLLVPFFIALTLTACGSSPVVTDDSTPPETPATQTGKNKPKKDPIDALIDSNQRAIAPGVTGTICTFGETKRELRIAKSAGTCRVDYLKDGTSQAIASGQQESAVCVDVYKRVKNNLVAAGYECD